MRRSGDIEPRQQHPPHNLLYQGIFHAQQHFQPYHNRLIRQYRCGEQRFSDAGRRRFATCADAHVFALRNSNNPANLKPIGRVRTWVAAPQDIDNNLPANVYAELSR